MKNLKFLALIGLIIGTASSANVKKITCYFNKDGKNCMQACIDDVAKEAGCDVVTAPMTELKCNKIPNLNTPCGECIDYCSVPK